MLDQLFAAMEKGGVHGVEEIAHFNGGLFDGRRALELDHGDIDLLVALGSMEWDQIDPTIFGTLFERFLDPDKRAQIGAHYTDPEKIMMIVEPVIVRPLAREWEAAKARIAALLDGSIKPPKSARTGKTLQPADAAEGERAAFLDRLRAVRILDPACGSGNFLYLALHAVKDIENRVVLETRGAGALPAALLVGPEIVHGIELNPLAAELARTTIWIGYIQWKIRNAIFAKDDPILRRLGNIDCRDALVSERFPPPRRGGWLEAPGGVAPRLQRPAPMTARPAVTDPAPGLRPDPPLKGEREAARPASLKRHGLKPNSSSATRHFSGASCCETGSATIMSRRCLPSMTAACRARPTSSPTGSRRHGKQSPRGEPRLRVWCRPTRSAAAPTARCWSG